MIIKTIGTGTFARVCLAKQKGSHKLVTIIMITILSPLSKIFTKSFVKYKDNFQEECVNII